MGRTLLRRGLQRVEGHLTARREERSDAEIGWVLQQLGLPVQGLGIDTDSGPVLLAWEDGLVSLLHRLGGAAGDQSPARLTELLRRNGEPHAARFALCAMPDGARRLVIRARFPSDELDVPALLLALQGILARLRARDAAVTALERRVAALRASVWSEGEEVRAAAVAEAHVEDALVALGADWRPLRRGWEIATDAGSARAVLAQRGHALALRLDIARDRKPPPPDVLHWMLEASDHDGGWFALRDRPGGPARASAMTVLSTLPMTAATLGWGLEEILRLAQRW
jgi:hypothetical protein